MSARLLIVGRNSELSPTVAQDVMGPAWSLKFLPGGRAELYSGNGAECVRGASRASVEASGTPDKQSHNPTIKDARAVPQTPPGVDWGEIAVLAGIGVFMLGFFIPWTLP